jgi:hypothetical protein
MGVTTPIYHLSPMLAAESGGVRAPSPDNVTSLPASGPDALALSFYR